jgi:Uma2 family endonuclease
MMNATATVGAVRRGPDKIRRITPHRRPIRPVGRPLVSAGQFLDWLVPGVHADLIAGQIFMHSPVSLRHADMVNFLDRLMGQYIEEFELGKLYRETVAVRLGARDVFLPDLAYFTREQAARLGATHADFAPALVVEALSPATAGRDRGAKFSAYEAHGVREYWLIDPAGGEHHFYRRAGDVLEEYAGGGEARIEAASLPGFWLKREWLSDAGRPPAVARCLAELRAARRRRAGRA